MTTIDEVREELGRLGLSQSLLARETGVSRQEVSRWLRGKRVPSPLNLNRMEAALERLEAYIEEAAAADLPEERYRG